MAPTEGFLATCLEKNNGREQTSTRGGERELCGSQRAVYLLGTAVKWSPEERGPGVLAGAQASEHLEVIAGTRDALPGTPQPWQPPASPKDRCWRSGSGCFSGLCGHFDPERLVIGITVRK